MPLESLMLKQKFDIDPLNPLDSDDFLPPVGRWMKLSGMFLVGTFGAAIALSAFIKYNTVVKASGMVRPSQEIQALEAATPGRVTRIQVKENQVVQAGEAIAQIDDTSLQNRRNQVKKYIEGLEVQRAQIKTKIDQYVYGNKPAGSRRVVIDANNFPALAPQLRQYGKITDNINSANQQIEQLTQGIENSKIRTPVAGTILHLDLKNVGQSVRPGTRIAQIVPKNLPLVIKANVPADSLGQLEVGQPVQLRVTAYPYPDYGTLKGKVSAIAPDAVTAQNNDPNFPAAAAYYEVTIQPDKTYLEKRNQKYNIQSGMGVTADIISTEETVLTFILRKARLATGV
jgi:multidrug efflux pump subunit AcrA (membrane-fusion protein)